MSTVPLLSDEEADPRARAVFDDIRATRGTDYVNNFWRALANDPDTLEATWHRLKAVMAEGALDPVVKELVYVAVSTANGCEYCVRSHTAAARAKGASEDALMELAAVVGMANQTNALVTAMQVPVDAVFAEPGAGAPGASAKRPASASAEKSQRRPRRRAAAAEPRRPARRRGQG
mgnify:CR=1 FL=1